MIYYGGDSGDNHIHRFGYQKGNAYGVEKFDLQTLTSQLDGKKWTPNGPVWLDSINDYDFVKQLAMNLEIL
jgi:hypothetical protein